MVLVNCGMGQENCEMFLELWDVPGLLSLVSYEIGPVSCGWRTGEVECFRMRLGDSKIANGTLAH